MVGTRPELIVEGGTVLTMTEENPIIPDGRVLIAGGRILAVEPGREPASSRNEGVPKLDARGGIIMPGLVNAHNHAAMSLFRGFSDDLPLQQWLFEKIFPAEAKHLNPESVYWGSLLSCLEMIASGTTCFADGYFFQDATVKAVQAAGLRGVLAQGVIDFPAPGVPDPAENLRTAAAFLDRWQGVSELIRPGVFCHSPLTCRPETLQKALEISRDRGSPLQIHLSETLAEVAETQKRHGRRPAQLLGEIGLLGPDLVAVHAVHLDEAEMDLLQEREVRVVHVPESNMKLGSGAAPVRQMLGRGMRLGLGTDGPASNNDLDLFREMDSAAKLSKVSSLDPTALDAVTALKMATRWGAAVLGLGAEVGSLEKGKSADLIVVDIAQPHLCPLYDPFSALVYAAGGGDVRDVLVRGRVLLKDRRFTFLDPEEIMGRVREICRSIRP